MVFGESRVSKMFALFALIYTKIKDFMAGKKKSLKQSSKRLGKES
jgi:hypothetical protein